MKNYSNLTSSDEQISPPQPEPRATTVLGLLTLAALTVSYLVAYAIAGALVDSDVLAHWPPAQDPRARWMAYLFAALMGTSLLVAASARILSRQRRSET